MKIIHFSDFHAGGSAEDWLAYLDKRWVGVFNYRFRRRFRHDQDKLRKAVQYILDARPDVAVCTGDLTSTGQPGEFALIKDIIKPLQDSAIPVLFVPGNHDYYVHREKCVRAMKEMFRFMNKGEFGFDDLPLAREIAGAQFIVVNESWPSNLISSCGYLKKQSSDFVEQVCMEAKTRLRIIVGHYPLIEEHPILRIRHRLWGQERVLKLLLDKQIDLSLCGHVHLPYEKVDKTGRGEYCAGSVTRNGCISEITYEQDKDIFSMKKISLE
jgi:3',5'-cyclic AMP phosphodiesterase CpdA